MPIYEYQCEACGAELEKLQKLSDPPLTDCPDCGRPALRKLISAAGFRLKGGGWYETDFKTDRQRNLHESARRKAEKSEVGGGKDRTAAAGDQGKSKKKKKKKKPDTTATTS